MKYWFIALLLLCLTGKPFGAEKDTSRMSQVLLLNSYHPGFKWTDDITLAIQESFNPFRTELHVDFMDTKRYNSQTYINNLKEFYKVKYAGCNFDVIICSDNYAYKFLSAHRDNIFGRVPVIYCGLNLNDSTHLDLSLSDGLTEHVEIYRGIQSSLEILPQTRHVYIIYDQTLTGKEIEQQVARAIEKLPEDLHYHLLSDISMEALCDTLQHVPENSLVYYTIFFADNKGQFFDYNQSASIITQAADAPVFAAWDFSLGHGVVGGLLTSGYFQGKAAAEMARQILEGASFVQLEFPAIPTNRYMYDYQLLKKFQIPTARLPENTKVINKPQRLLSAYKEEIIAGIVVMVVLTITIILLAGNIIRRKRAEAERLAEHRRLDHLVTDRTKRLEGRIEELTAVLFEKENLQKEVERLKRVIMQLRKKYE